jgi:hypothetical protein
VDQTSGAIRPARLNRERLIARPVSLPACCSPCTIAPPRLPYIVVIAHRWDILSHLRLRQLLFVAALAGALALPACNRGPSSTSQPARPARDDPDRVAPPAVKPEYHFAPELREQFPEITAFMQRFIETCAAGDYAGYRRLVSHYCDPESRDRFQAVLNGIQTLNVTSIERLDRPRLSDEVYLVTCKLDFLPGAKVHLRRRIDAVAILVLKEIGDWRMMPAPADLQPTAEEAETPLTTTSAPSYPWDEDGNY